MVGVGWVGGGGGVLSHVSNQHGFTFYNKCSHGEISDEMSGLRNGFQEILRHFIPWKRLYAMKTYCETLPHLTMFTHSGNLEVSHSLYNVYSSKRLSFPYACMHVRTQLAVLVHDSGVGRKHSTTKYAKLRYNTI